jgi:glycosyltransferase involved in cell wall biosynthesis
MMYQSLEKLHADIGFDLFHSFFLYPVGFVTGMLARCASVPHIVTIVGNDIKRYLFSPEKVAVCRSGLENSDRVVGLSRDLVNMANALIPLADKARVIYNSVEVPEQVWSSNRDPDRPFRIGCAGIFKYAKGLPYLFKAVSAVAAAGGNVTLELVGTIRESEREIFAHMLERTGIQELLAVRDPLSHEAVADWLRTLDLFVLPSLTEGCPNILMEAMASGVPSVATRTGAVEDLMVDRVSGLLVPWGDSRALAHAISQVMENSSLARSLGTAARARMADFSREAERRAWEKVYRELIEF